MNGIENYQFTGAYESINYLEKTVHATATLDEFNLYTRIPCFHLNLSARDFREF